MLAVAVFVSMSSTDVVQLLVEDNGNWFELPAIPINEPGLVGSHLEFVKCHTKV